VDTLKHSPEHLKLVLNARLRGSRVLSSILDELRTCRSFRFCVAFVNREGVACLLQALADLKSRGVNGQILVSQYLNFTDPVALRTLSMLSNIEVKIATEGAMHSKGYYFDHSAFQRFIIGSSNWTAAALSTNTELNIRVQTPSESILSKEIDLDFEAQYQGAEPVTPEFIERYERVYYDRLNTNSSQDASRIMDAAERVDPILNPNQMQVEALGSLARLREAGKAKALIVSATGTGKTLLSAFDAKAVGARRLLFVVHRENIARAAMLSFKRVFGHSRSYGLYCGSERSIDADFIFSTVQTLSREEHYGKFSKTAFDYIVVDESHRAEAASYRRFIEYFAPSFLLGMTATPERSDGADIFRYFDYNIAYEIRLHHALELQVLCPFHYFGVADLAIEGDPGKDLRAFNRLIGEERINLIVEKARFYGCYNGIVRGLIFCTHVDEARSLSEGLNRFGYRSIALSGGDSEESREQSIRRLEAPVNSANRLDYIITVDIFNEGVDIPLVNQIILLRATNSPIVFVQQLGRGLRKVPFEDKFLTVIDFIGNYANNYLIPIALYGDRSYTKDRIRRLLVEASEPLPGTSTINFDPIAKERIFESVNSARTETLSSLRSDFKALQLRIGRVPMMMDFILHDSRDPAAFSNYSKSFYGFARGEEPKLVPHLSDRAAKVLEILSADALNGKSIEEPVLLNLLLNSRNVSIEYLNQYLLDHYNIQIEDRRLDSLYSSVNLRFLRKAVNQSLVGAGESIGVNWVGRQGDSFQRLPDFEDFLQEIAFKDFVQDLILYATHRFKSGFERSEFHGGFQLYEKYSRADVFRILGLCENPVAQNVGGYLVAADKSWCPLFVTYRKSQNQSLTTHYKDTFISREEMLWFSKNRRYLTSPDVCFFREASEHQRILLFVQKSNDEGMEFYYMGDVQPRPETFAEEFMSGDDGKLLPVVRMRLALRHPVRESLYAYITE
jgi:superfamily II DNA or RNA helicase/HKD family nuclease